MDTKAIDNGNIGSSLSFEADIRNAVETMRRGGIILYPTDTVWGIGCDASDPDAVAKIYALKRRDDSKSMLSLVDSVAMLERTVDDIPEAAYQLIEAAVDRKSTRLNSSH